MRVLGGWGENYLHSTLHLLVSHPALGEDVGRLRLLGGRGCREGEGAGRVRVLGGWGWELPPQHAPSPGTLSSPRWGCREDDSAGREGEGETLHSALHLLVSLPALGEDAGRLRVLGRWGCREYEGAGSMRVLGGWGWELPPWHAPPPGIPSSPRWGCREVKGTRKVRVQGAWGCREGEGAGRVRVRITSTTRSTSWYPIQP